MHITRRSFLKTVGALGTLALVAPTGAIEAIVGKVPGMPLPQGEFGIIDRFTMYCRKQPRGHVGHSVCALETVRDQGHFGTLMRGLSIGRDKRSMKYFSCIYDLDWTPTEKQFKQFCGDACKQLELAWRHDKKQKKWWPLTPWGVAPPTITQKEAFYRIEHGKTLTA